MVVLLDQLARDRKLSKVPQTRDPQPEVPNPAIPASPPPPTGKADERPEAPSLSVGPTSPDRAPRGA